MEIGEEVTRNKTTEVSEALIIFLLIIQVNTISPVIEIEISDAIMKQRILKSYSAYLKQSIKTQIDIAAVNKKALEILAEIII